jgi:DNA-binding NarL/FixJ family response regulator
MIQLKPIGVFIVDDHELVRRGLRQLIDGTPDLFVCGEAASTAQAMRLLQDCAPDVTVVDLCLPDGNGLDLIKRLHLRCPDTVIVVSSMHDEELFAERALLAGARGYINKQETATRVLDAIRQVVKGEIFLSEAMTERLSNQRDANGAPPGQSSIDQLSDRELEVFELIGRGRSTVEIAEALHLSVKTIETYRAHIKEKLNLESSSALTRYAIQWSLQGR